MTNPDMLLQSNQAAFSRAGTVALVGAGPGDASLITVRGLDRLRSADVVLYDRLVAPALLGEAPPRAERICVGKARGRKRLSQEEIEALMVAKARAGKVVVRLKGGDPFVFGRGGEEALALAEAGVPFEIVPGVTSAVAVPEAAGIPVTHRGVSGAFAVWTGRRSPGEAVQAVDAPTQVVLMGVEALPETVELIAAAGRPRSTPAAVISWGATVRQRAVFGTLADIAERAKAAGIGAPATVVVGDVVEVGRKISAASAPGGTGAAGVAAAGDEAARVAAARFAAPGSASGGARPGTAPGGVFPWAALFSGKRVALSRKLAGDPLAQALERAGAEPAPLPLVGDGFNLFPEVAGCLLDMIVEEMIDAALFDSPRALFAFRRFVDGSDPAIEEQVARFPAYLAEGEHVAPVPLTGDGMSASRALGAAPLDIAPEELIV
mgnify:CR=1 FL=1